MPDSRRLRAANDAELIMVECPACNGTGRRHVQVLPNASPYDYDVPCSWCIDTGRCSEAAAARWRRLGRRPKWWQR